MSKPTFFWHDYETFGTNARRDRPAQFGALRTDADLNIIGEPLELYCRPPEDIVPTPEATLITGITPQMAEARGVPEPEFIGRIFDAMTVPGTCNVGYNSLRFDDEVTRHTLWRNFFDPYVREWRSSCSRWDLIDTVRLTYALRPDGIVWPERPDEPGVPSFRLEHLAAANELEQENAHDALSDVRATIALARLIRDRKPKLWQWVHAHRDKRSARALFDLQTRRPLLHVSQMFPARIGCLSPVMPLTEHPTNRNEIITFDLRHDPTPLLELSPEDIAERMFTPAGDLPDDAPRVALKGIRVNKCPVLAPFDMLGEREADRLQLDINACRRHWKQINDHIDTVTAKIRVIHEARQFEPASDPEAGLYDGFVGDDDRKRCDRVRQADADALAADDIVFDDKRLNDILFRYRARHYPNTLNAAEQDDWHQHVARQLAFAPDGGLTLDQFNDSLDALMPHYQGQPDKLQLLLDLKAWGQRLARHV